MFGPAESAYPGTPIALAFLCVMAAVLLRSVFYARNRRLGAKVEANSWLNAVVIAAVALLFLVVLWAMLLHRR